MKYKLKNLGRGNSAKTGMRNVVFLGLVSFFADISTEMVYPLIPLYLTSAFGATPVLIGVIEGIAESVASLLKVFSGYASDRWQHKKPLAFCGYALGVAYKIALIFASSWTGVLLARVTDRVGKGIRTSPRDVMVSESADKTKMGLAFGLHKALDMAGSAIGILAAFLLVLRYSGGNYRPIFLISLIPMAFALGMFAFIHEDKSPREAVKREPLLKNIKQLDGRLKLYLVVVTLFTLGNSSNTFLLLRAGSEGFSDTSVILLYFAYNVSASVLAVPLGKLSDRIGRKSVLVAGYLTFSAVYFGFAFVSSKPLMAAVFVLYGVYTALTAGVERAFIAEIAPPSLKGTMLGLESTLVGIALLPASIIAGALWDAAGAFAPFTLGAALSLAAALTLAFGLKAPEKQTKYK